MTDGDPLTEVDRTDRHNVSLILDVTWDPGADGSGLHDGTVLEHISWIIMATVRTTDIVYRHGHAQFCVLLPASPSDAGTSVADRIRDQIDRSDVLSSLGIVLQVQVDGGAPATDRVDESVDRAISILGDAASNGPLIATEQLGSASTPARTASGIANARTHLAVQGTGAPVPPIGDLPSALLPD